MKPVPVRVTWAQRKGGSTQPPPVTRYADIARFPDDGPAWPDGAWTVVLDFPTPPADQDGPIVGTARFLMDDAPHSGLRPGAVFDLYRGLTYVATVEVL